MECREIVERALESQRLGFKCVPLDGRLLVITPYLYPDNDLVEVFVEEVTTDRIRVTDMGETLRHLESLGVDVFGSSKRRFLLDQIARRLHIQVHRGRLEAEGGAADVGSLLMDIIAAAQSVASLIYMSRAYEPATFSKEVSMFLEENDVTHEYRPSIEGESGKKYRVSIRVDGKRPQELLVEALSPPQETGITATVNSVVRKWVDINSNRAKVSLLNDVDYLWKREDISILGRWSEVHLWTRKEQFLQFVRIPSL